MPRAVRAAAALLAALALAAAPARAVERVVRVYDEQRGLFVAEVSALAQDAGGFLWVGTIGGLSRFDGRTIRPWAPDSLRHVVAVLASDPRGTLVVGGLLEPLYRVTPEGVAPIAGADGRAIRGWSYAALADDGGLWVALDDSLAWCDRAGRWRGRRAGSPMGAVERLFPAGGGDVYAATAAGLWRVSPSGVWREVAPFAHVRAVALDGDALFALTARDGLMELRGGRVIRRLAERVAGSALVRRGARLYASFDQYVVSLPIAGGEADTIAPAPGVLFGKSLLVDREGSLWIGGFRGLQQLPEPETVTWNEGDGLASPTHARFVAKNDEGVWVSTWWGLSRLAPAGRPRGVVEDWNNRWRVVLDGGGRLWTGGLGGFHERRAGAWAFHAVPGESLLRIASSSPSRDGAIWIGASAGLYRVRPGDPAPVLVPGPPPPGWGRTWRDVFVFDALEDRHGTLWVTNGDAIAHAASGPVARGAPVRWVVETPRDVQSCDRLAEMPSGDLWLATGNGGVRRRAGGRWEEVPGTRALASRRIFNFAPSPRGGLWIGGNGILIRVAERPDLPDGWRVLERLGAWEGMPNQSGAEVLEERDGRLWIASLAGLTEVPPVARAESKPPPDVRLVDAVVDGRSLPLGMPPRLPYRRNRLELHFAALSFRDPNLLRYQIRSSRAQPWVESRDPDFRFVDLEPGHHAVEVRASLDGVRWSDPPVRVAFTVLRPWWQEGWALALAATALAALLYGVYKLRVTFLLRLERQRARIAMDLHDEMGSGLGSIGLLAGLAADQTVDDASRRALASQIAEAAGDLGGALSDIVWSLRRDGGTLEALALRVAERARRLFPEVAQDGARAELVARFPADWPRVELPLELRRNLQLMAIEALHNAARHAGATRVELGLAREGANGAWRLWVSDDGAGLPPGLVDAAGLPTGAARGNGLRNLAERARGVGARIRWRAREGGGTCVEIAFDPHGAHARPSHERATAAGRRVGRDSRDTP